MKPKDKVDHRTHNRRRDNHIRLKSQQMDEMKLSRATLRETVTDKGITK